MYEHHALGYWLSLALCLTKVRSSRARCPATALICIVKLGFIGVFIIFLILIQTLIVGTCRGGSNVCPQSMF